MVWEGKVIMFNPYVCAYSIAFSVTWDPCPSKMSKCLVAMEMPLSINLLKKNNNNLNKKLVAHVSPKDVEPEHRFSNYIDNVVDSQ